MRILVVEDDQGIASSVVEAIEALGWTAIHADTGNSAIQTLDSEDIDCVVLDLGLPDMDGGEVVRRTREHSMVPIIVASARPDESDRILALELGADDYLVKPFGIRELIARIRAIQRRQGNSDPDASDKVDLTIGPVIIGLKSRRVTVSGNEIGLTPKEFDVLAYLAQEPGTVFRREAILSDVWDINWYGSTKTLDAHVASLRKKLGNPDWIESVRGVGFRLNISA
ncbi:MAG: response regulator transcription factor [Pontimonas sp.]